MTEQSDAPAGGDVAQDGRMLLFWSSRSPYVRKVMIVAHERGLADEIALTPVDVTLVSGSPAVAALNPLGQIPTLVTRECVALYDSATICAHLDTLGPVAPLIPHDPAARVAMQRRHALADGVVDAMVAWRSERNRTDQLRDRRRDAYRAKIERALDVLAVDAAEAPPDRFDLADAALASALRYGEFRSVLAPDWADRRAPLGEWLARARARPSVAATEFRDPLAA